MRMLELPHKVADCRCPVNGLCDVYEWKTGQRFPEELIINACMGFQIISNKNAPAPRMIFLSYSRVGRTQYDFWAQRLGYRLLSGEGRVFPTAWSEVTQLIDQEIPVILFALDMYHLTYLEKFYHKIHVPGHIVLLVGYDDVVAYVHDNSKEGIQKIRLEDLKLAWENDYLGISKKNAYFGVCMDRPNYDMANIMRDAFRTTAEMYLHPKLSFIGLQGMQRLQTEIPQWPKMFTQDALKAILTTFSTFTGSVLPELPDEIREFPLGFMNPHGGGRDLFARALLDSVAMIGCYSWIQLAKQLDVSSLAIEAINTNIVSDFIQHASFNTEKYGALFEALKVAETPVYNIMEDL